MMELLRAARLMGKAFQLSGLQGKPRFLLEGTGLLHLFKEVEREPQPDGASQCGGVA